ncbi:MAG: Rap1a/Tai family immunity protein [Terriglobales bacterium]|jgi:hypothetical protein
MKFSLVILFLAALAQTSTFAQNRFTENGKTFSQDGSQMVANCMAKGATMEAMLCGGYVEGIADLLSDKGVCIPPELEGKQLVDVFLKYVKNHQDKLHGPASRIVADALKDGYSCSTRNNVSQP